MRIWWSRKGPPPPPLGARGDGLRRAQNASTTHCGALSAAAATVVPIAAPVTAPIWPPTRAAKSPTMGKSPTALFVMLDATSFPIIHPAAVPDANAVAPAATIRRSLDHTRNSLDCSARSRRPI